MNAPMIAVVIPFFQREKGILSKALTSVRAQGYPGDRLYVLVVDDGSPVPADEEIADAALGDSLRVRVVKKQNSGPNEARNLGLDSLDPGTDLVAYLDSDDEWTGKHLERAVSVMSRGYTAYFANLYHLGDTVPEFEKAKRVTISEHPAIGDETLREYVGDMTRQVVTANIIFMPSLVIDARALGHVRFPQAHRHGGGDYLYWLELIVAGARFAFSTLPEVKCGRGINMWYSSGWGTDGVAKRALDEARFRKKALDRYVKDAATRRQLQRRISELQFLLIRDSVHRLRRRKPVDWGLLRRAFVEIPPSPSFPAFASREAISAVASRIRGR